MASILETLKEFHDAQLFLPIVCVLHTVDLIGMRYHHLNIFPAFYSVNRRASIPQILARFFSKDQYSLIDCIIDIHELSIFLVDSSDIHSIYTLAKDMTASFTENRRLNLWFKFGCEIVSFLLNFDDYNCA